MLCCAALSPAIISYCASDCEAAPLSRRIPSVFLLSSSHPYHYFRFASCCLFPLFCRALALDNVHFCSFPARSLLIVSRRFLHRLSFPFMPVLFRSLLSRMVLAVFVFPFHLVSHASLCCPFMPSLVLSVPCSGTRSLSCPLVPFPYLYLPWTGPRAERAALRAQLGDPSGFLATRRSPPDSGKKEGGIRRVKPLVGTGLLLWSP